jgi:hypothetical protein
MGGMDANYKPFWYLLVRPWRWTGLGWCIAIMTWLAGYLIGFILVINAHAAVGIVPMSSPIFRIVYSPIISIWDYAFPDR